MLRFAGRRRERGMGKEMDEREKEEGEKRERRKCDVGIRNQGLTYRRLEMSRRELIY